MNLGLPELLIVLVVLLVPLVGVAAIVLAARAGGRRAAERDGHSTPYPPVDS